MDIGVHSAHFGTALSDAETAVWRALPTEHQPIWTDEALAAHNRRVLASRSGLVRWREVRGLRLWLAEVAAGRALVLQSGDCAENPVDCRPDHVRRKLTFLDSQAALLHRRTGLPVLRVGRIAGQFAKPRSQPTEHHGSIELPAFHGHLVNAPERDPVCRQPDATRLLSCYLAGGAAMEVLRERLTSGSMRQRPPVWASHEALLMDYELPLLRRDTAGRTLLTSTHWPWVGDRTRHPDHGHVRMLAALENPVACKIGPRTEEGELLHLCATLNPRRQPGRLTFIARMGVAGIDRVLPRLVSAVARAGHPVIWLCDPMHGNTLPHAERSKTRHLDDVVSEIRAFRDIMRTLGGVSGGLHLEATHDLVTECVGGGVRTSDVPSNYTTLCDPRLNAHQAATAITAWC